MDAYKKQITPEAFKKGMEAFGSDHGGEMTYQELVDFCGNERQAWFLSTQIRYREMSIALEDAVLDLLVKLAERTQQRGKFRLEYVGGQNLAYRRK